MFFRHSFCAFYSISRVLEDVLIEHLGRVKSELSFSYICSIVIWSRKRDNRKKVKIMRISVFGPNRCKGCKSKAVKRVQSMCGVSVV